MLIHVCWGTADGIYFVFARVEWADVPNPELNDTEVTVVLTTVALYVFPPILFVDEHRFLPLNSYRRYPLDEIVLCSLPYFTRYTRDGDDFAERLEDVVIHFEDQILHDDQSRDTLDLETHAPSPAHSLATSALPPHTKEAHKATPRFNIPSLPNGIKHKGKTNTELWLRIVRGDRSEFVDILSRAFKRATDPSGQKDITLQLYNPDIRTLLLSLDDFSIVNVIKERKLDWWSRHIPFLEGAALLEVHLTWVPGVPDILQQDHAQQAILQSKEPTVRIRTCSHPR